MTTSSQVSKARVEVRAVQPDEYEDAGNVVVAAYEALAGNTTSHGYAAELRAVAERVAGTEVLVALRDGAVIGCVTFVPDCHSRWAEMVLDGESAVRMLGVSPAAQGLGVGRLLLEACIAQAVKLGSQALFLHSTPWMKRAQQMYLAAGFVRVPERDWSPVPEVPLMAYRLELRPT